MSESSLHSRTEVAVSVERCALGIRYVLWAIFAPVFWFDILPGEPTDIILITIILFAHSVFAHWVLYTRRTQIFLSTVNFIAHFLVISLLVMLSSPQSSQAFVLYLLLLIGVGAYTRSYWRTMGAALLCTLAFGATVWLDIYRYGMTDPVGLLAVKLTLILTCGWLLATVSARTRQIEEASDRQALALAASETTLRGILNHVDSPILVYDRGECVVEANEQASLFLGVEREALLGQRFRQFIFDDGTLPAHLAHVRTHGEGHSEEVVVLAGGDERTAEIGIRSFSFGEEPLFVVVLVDITERKDLQEAARLANMHLDQLNRELRQVDALKTEFLTAISQRLRSPLSAALGYVSTLLTADVGTLTPDQRVALQNCRGCIQRVFGFVDDALDISTLDSHNLPRPPSDNSSETAEHEDRSAVRR